MSGEYEDAGVENRSLRQCGSEGPVQAVLEVFPAEIKDVEEL